MDLGGDMPITLIVKAPNQRIADHPVECMMGWTIRKLKEHLENVYPSKPRHNQQKLIYSGRLLDDHLTLKEVLRQNDVESSHHTVHLVCAPTSEGYSAGPASVSPSPAPESAPSTSPSSSLPSSSPGGVATAMPVPPPHPYLQEGLRYRGYGMPQAQAAGVPQMMMPMATMGGYPYPAAAAAYHPQQVAYMQHMYAYMQYLQHYQMAAANAPAGTASLPNAQVHPPPAAAAAAANANAAPGNQNMRMNAQGGMVDDEDEDEMNRDWLDYLYIFFRFIVLVSIVYFYSNFSRFLAVCTGVVVFVVLQRMWPRMQEMQRAFQREAQGQPDGEEEAAANAPANNNDTPPNNNNVPSQGSNADTAAARNDDGSPQPATPQSDSSAGEPGTGETSSAEQEQQQQQQQQQRPREHPKPNPLVVFYTFITTFFTSLIPEQPEPVHLN